MYSVQNISADATIDVTRHTLSGGAAATAGFWRFRTGL